MQGISIIGPGRLGGALALALERSGSRVESIVFKSRPGAERIAAQMSVPAKLVGIEDLNSLSPVVLITTADTAIEEVGRSILPLVSASKTVLHSSGSLSSDVLSMLRPTGCSVGSMHPLVSVSDPKRGAERFRGSYFCVEGDEQAVVIANELVEFLGGKPFTIDTRFKPLYHAAAVTASGHLVALCDTAFEMLEACGVEPESAKKIFLPLISSTLENIQNQRAEDALTGPFARLDLDVYERHIASFSDGELLDTLAIYLALAERSLLISERRGAEPERIQAMRERISIAKRNIE